MPSGAMPITELGKPVPEDGYAVWSWGSESPNKKPEMKTYQVVIENYNSNGGMQVEEIDAVRYEFDSVCQYIRFFDEDEEVVACIGNHGVKIIKIKAP